MSNDIMLPEEKLAADIILKKMGLTESEKYKNEIEYDLSNEYDKFQDVYDNRNIVEKPKSVIRDEEAKESARRGANIDEIVGIKDIELKPLKDTLIMRMDNEKEQSTNSGIFIANLRAVKQDIPSGIVTALNDETTYEFKLGDHIIIDLRYVKHRYNSKGNIYLILNKDGVLGIHEKT